MRGNMMDYPLTLTPLLDRAGKLFGKREIVSRLPDRSLHRYTMVDFHRRARALAEALLRAGLQPGDRVGTLMVNHYAHLEASFGVPVAGGVFHALNFRLHPSELVFLIQHAEDRFLIVDEVLLRLFESFKDEVHLERVFVVSFSAKPVPENYEDYEEFLQQATGKFTSPVTDENAAAAMCSTSGTTGKPKSVLYSHRAMALRGLMLAMPDCFNLAQRDVTLSMVPFFHLVGWNMPALAVLVGTKLVFPGPHMDAESLLDLMESERVTFSGGVPTIWMDVREALERDTQRWTQRPPMRAIVGGTAPSEALLRALDGFGIHLIHAWAMTETYPGVFSQPKPHMDDWPEDQLYKLRCKQGIPGPFYEIRAVAEDGTEAPWDGETMGELQVRSPGTAASYYNMPEEGEKWTADGWFRTGDVATIDPEGYVKIVDRSKDMVKSGGEWISSVDLENALMSHPDVREAAVVAVPHPKWQERQLAVVVPRDGASPGPEQLRDFLDARFAKWQLPDAFAFVEEIPRTSTGKFLKTRLREQYAGWYRES